MREIIFFDLNFSNDGELCLFREIEEDLYEVHYPMDSIGIGYRGSLDYLEELGFIYIGELNDK